MIVGLAIKSLRNRKFTAALTVIAIALAVALLLGVERLRHESRESFASTVSGTDLIVGARGSPVHLLLSSVFRIGNPTNNISWDSYRELATRPEIAWTIPLALGDSHRGFRVVGTTHDYFEHFRFARDRKLELALGEPFEQRHDAVLGADVAQSLKYALGREFIIAHGTGDVALSEHKDQPFRVVGVLARTGTPVDRAIHVSLEGIDAVHSEKDHDPLAAAQQAAGPTAERHADEHADDDEQRAISAFLVGLKSRGTALQVQRLVNEFPKEPLTAILPGVTLLEVWEITGAAERTLFSVSALVVLVSFGCMLVALLTAVSERRREMAVLRSVGARPSQVFALIVGEAGFLTLLGIALAVIALYVGLLAGQPWLESRLGLFIGLGWPSLYEFGAMMLVVTVGVLIGLIPAYRMYRLSLADGMTIRM
jgi:putative ABC transport system permease protein